MSAIAEAPAPAQTGSAFPSSSGEIKASSLMAPATIKPNVSADKISNAFEKRMPPVVRAPIPAVEGAPKVVDDGKKPSEKLFDNLRGLAKDPNAPDKAPEATKTPKTDEEGEQGDDLLGESAEKEPRKSGVEAEKTPEVIDKKKVNPWKLADEHKKARAQLEAEVADLKKLVANPETRKAEVERLTAIEKRNQELEETIRFVDYSKSKEFTDKYQKPYEAAWTRAMSELKELTVEDTSTGETRSMAPADLLELVNMPLKQARERADELYGAAANDVMNYRKEIRGLYEQQSQALDQARKSGVEKHKLDTDQHTQKMQALQAETSKHWEAVNKAIIENETTGPYFRPVEGNDEINGRLEKGYKFVDETMAMNPLNPDLTPEQRQDAIKRHASLRHRAAAFGRMRHEVETLRKQYKGAMEKLSQFEKSVPNFGGDSQQAAEILANGGKMSGLMQRLQAKAR